MKRLEDSRRGWVAWALCAATGCAGGSDTSADTNTSWVGFGEHESHAAQPEPHVERIQDASVSYDMPISELVPDGEPFALTAPESGGGPPSTRWVGDHWVVAWMARTPIQVVDVSLDGEVNGSRQYATASEYMGEIELAEDGRIGVLLKHFGFAPDARGGCLLEQFAANAPDGAKAWQTFEVPCGDDAQEIAAAPVPDSEDWVLAYGEGHQGGSFVVGRYRPSLNDWVVTPKVVAPRVENDPLDVYVAAGDAIVAWAGDDVTNVAVWSGLAAADIEPVPTFSRWQRQVDGGLRSYHGALGSSRPGPNDLLFGLDGYFLWATPIVPGSDVAEVRDVAPATIDHQPPGVALLGATNTTAVCYSTGAGHSNGSGGVDGVSCILVDAQGMPTTEPLVIANDLDSIGGVAAAWSGDRLLVVYWDITFGDSMSEPGTSAIRGQILVPQ